MVKKVAIQGYPGSFHDEACTLYFEDKVETIPADSFEILGSMLKDGMVDLAVMAIENSIAGTILQNYRILREGNFWISGEKYLRISHHLMANKEATLSDIKEIHSHPMAINQCLHFLSGLKGVKLVETEDTALSAQHVKESGRKDLASISSVHAADLYDLKILSRSIETNPTNYTRFFVLERDAVGFHAKGNKASIYVRIPDVRGQLLKVLQVIDDHKLNMSKLQSFPVLGSLREYFFHIDIEFERIEQYQNLRSDLSAFTHEYTELGIYQRDNSITKITH